MHTWEQIEAEWCKRFPVHFIKTYCQILAETPDGQGKQWIPFRLWPVQEEIIGDLKSHRRIVTLKARQLGISWVVIAYVLWLMRFHPIADVLLFSKTDAEAIKLLDEMLRPMYERLPPWLKEPVTRRRHGKLPTDAKHYWQMPNGSQAKAFPTTGGRSYTGTFVLVDEADWIQDLDSLMSSVEETVGVQGQLVLVSTSDKSKPTSGFKRIYMAARDGTAKYHPIFHAWDRRPGRDQAWYDERRAVKFARTGSDDEMHQELPATDTEALSPRSLDKRIAPAWLHACSKIRQPIPTASLPPDAPSIPGLEVYVLPEIRRRYILGSDPAEGNPTSDDSALTILDEETGEEVAALAGKIQPETMGIYAGQLATWYNRGKVMVERNNHGHAVLLAIRTHYPMIVRMLGHDGKEGWLSSGKGKALLYDACADAFRHGDTILHSFMSFVQLASIEGNTLRAPEGERDDRCLAAGTMVETMTGEKPIETIQPGEFVLTRKGFRRVLKAGMSNPSEEIWEAELSNGRTLRGTSDHPVWVEGSGFSALDTLAFGCRMLACKKQESKRLFSTAPSSADTLIPRRGIIGSISLESLLARRFPLPCIGRSGSMLTEPFRMGISFIIGTAIPSTTLLKISNACLVEIIPTSTRDAEIIGIPETGRSWKKFVRWLLFGMPPKKALPGIARTQKRHGRSEIQSNLNVLIAGRSSLPCQGRRVSVSALERAGRELTRSGIRLKDHALNAESGSSPASSSLEKSAPVAVVRVRLTGRREPVFNLTVEGEPEFFASGILVHNSDSYALCTAAIMYRPVPQGQPVGGGERTTLPAAGQLPVTQRNGWPGNQRR